MGKSRWEQLLMSLSVILEITETNMDITFDEVKDINLAIEDVLDLFKEYEKPDEQYYAWREMLEHS